MPIDTPSTLEIDIDIPEETGIPRATLKFGNGTTQSFDAQVIEVKDNRK